MNPKLQGKMGGRLLQRTLDALEGWTRGSRPWLTMACIVVVGTLSTAMACALLWKASQQRDRHEFEVLASMMQSQVSDRLAHRRELLLLASGRWSNATLPPSMSGSGFTSGELVTVRRGAPAVDELMGWLHLAEGSRALLTPFWQTQVVNRRSGDQPVVSPRLTDVRGRSQWLLVQTSQATAVSGLPHGWVVVAINDAALLPVIHPSSTWAWRLSLGGRPSAPLDGLQHAAPVSPLSTTQGPWLWLTGEALGLGWWDTASRHGGMWIAAFSGALVTLGCLYGYGMLISIRTRAKAMTQRATAALQRSESRNRAVVDTAPDSIITVDDDAHVLWCNQATVSIFGQTLDDLRGRPLWSVVPALEGQCMKDWFYNHGVSNRVLSYETEGCRAEGTRFPIAVSASRAELAGEVINTFIVRDTTDAKWAERELLLRERALESSEDAVIIMDMNLPGCPMIFANPAFERITGYGVYEVLGSNCRFLQGEDRDQPAVATMRAAIEQGRACQVVLRNYRKDGSLFWNELSISPVRGLDERVTHYVGIASDITDRMASEQVLYLRTERLNAVFDLSPDGFVVLDKRRELSIVNPAFERMTGLQAVDLVGQHVDAFEERLASLCTSVEQDEADAAQGGSARELLHLHSPTLRTLMRRVRHGGHDNETVMYFRDITHELEVDRMKSEFLSMAAHELRTPMASIFGFTELLLKRNFDDVRRQDVLSTIHRQASILINLVNELLDLARIESRRGKDFKRQRHHLQALLTSTVEALLVHNDDRRVRLGLPAEPVHVDVDAEKLSLAITNVLSNAYKYSPQGGEIELELVWRDRDGRRECGVQVTDHGIGMTPHELARVFERFFRADTSGNIPGTGLGMTIVKEIVELHGGQVVLSSQSGVGTQVTLWIPVLSPTVEVALEV